MLLGRLAAAALRESANARVLLRTGAVGPVRPDRLLRMGLIASALGPTLGTAVGIGAVRHPGRAAVVDEDGTLSYSRLWERSRAIATGLSELGVGSAGAGSASAGAGSASAGAGAEGRVGLLARNHRGFLEAVCAAALLGADVVLLNTGFSGPQLDEVCAREGVGVLVADAEFSEVVGELRRDRRVVSVSQFDSLARDFAGSAPPRPGRTGQLTLLTSGTTGTPRGARRDLAGMRVMSLDMPAGLIERIPLRAGMRIGLAAPAFHAWGLGGLALGLGLGGTLVTRRRFEPEAWLAAVQEHRIEALFVVPVMLERILALPAAVRESYDTSSLAIVAASGSALSADLAVRWMDAFGENLHNFYGSTEVAAVAIATPRDLRPAPGSVGRPVRGTTVRLLDDAGREVPAGGTGRIFVGNAAVFAGYTGGEDKLRVDGLVSSGDMGRIDAAGRLWVEGRDDEMIVSGGENVFPQEVEEVLAAHPGVREAAVVGVPDEEWGARLLAFVVRVPSTGEGEAGARESTVSEAELQEHVRRRLARFKVPREIVFLDALPRNATGKVLRRALPGDPGPV